MSCRVIALLACAVPLSLNAGFALPRTTVVFVCEHGAAKSVIAAAYFNKLAAERHLPFHAVARGTTPQPDISVSAAKGLETDGVPFETRKPRALTTTDAADAVRIVAFCPVPKSYARIARVDEHDDVPAVSENYEAARDAILGYVRQLLDELQADAGGRRR